MDPPTPSFRMHQPRFGGVAQPPLSSFHGEGKPEGSISEAKGSKIVHDRQHLRVDTDRHSEINEAMSSCPTEDSGFQKVMDVLCELGISTEVERHKLKHERQRDSGTRQTGEDGVYCKNLLLKDKKGQAFLVLCDEEDKADLQVLKYHFHVQGNLHFASKESMWKLLRVAPGAVTPLALIHPTPGEKVRLFVDREFLSRIDRAATKLFFHPIRGDLQVGLTFTQLEKFLHHCNVNVEMLPSLTRYEAGRRYGSRRGGDHSEWQEKQPYRNNLDNFTQSDTHSAHTEDISSAVPQQSAAGDTLEQSKDFFSDHKDTIQQLGVNVEIHSTTNNTTLTAANCTLVPCKCVYLKDKRDHYFLFVCHENQKVDFSNLKMQLKPRKKIEPLDREELQSLLHLCGGQESPFPLADVKQPRFLVAIADNLHQLNNPVLTFPHPSDTNLHLRVTLKHLEIFVRGVNHDLMTIPVKGKIEALQTASKTLVQENHASSADSSDNAVQGLESPAIHTTESRSSTEHHLPSHSGNLFYQMTMSLREWVWRRIRWLAQLLHHYLPENVSSMMSRSALWQRMLTSGHAANSGQSEHGFTNSDHPRRNTDDTERERQAKIAKLQQLMEVSGIPVELTESPPPTQFLKDDAEYCKTYLLEDGQHRPYFIFCPDEDDPTDTNLRQLLTAFRPRSSFQLMSDDGIRQLLSWEEEESTFSWTQEDLNPFAAKHMDPVQALGRVRVGMTGELYVFPDTMLAFHLPSLGMTLRVNSDDLDRMLRRLGYCVVYLP